ncbi:MAG: rhomboid family intramembrane serine protease [Planctomycetes bacterium]|nr:rhomboid family intramembrane serine protease [Planctomycetota bacterium]
MMPLADDNSGRVTFPFVNYVLIGINVLVFVIFQGLGENVGFTFAFSTVPREIVTGQDLETPPQVVEDRLGQVHELPGLQPTPIPVYLTLITSMFMHGGLMHLLGNMLFLWIFGDNIEDALGHARYICFYLVCGVLAGLAHVFSVVGLDGVDSPAALIPSLGASGAISGVLAGYVLLFPHRRVLVLLLRILVWVPAWVAIGIWFGFQLINGLGMLGAGSQQSGVAYAAHLGGFVAGLALTPLFAIGDPWRDRQDRWPGQRPVVPRRWE